MQMTSTAAAPARQFLSLSPEEKQICRLLAQGLTVAEVAEATGASLLSVRSRISRAMQREHCSTCLRLVVRYLEEYCGVLDPIEA